MTKVVCDKKIIDKSGTYIYINNIQIAVLKRNIKSKNKINLWNTENNKNFLIVY